MMIDYKSTRLRLIVVNYLEFEERGERERVKNGKQNEMNWNECEANLQ